MGLGWVLERGIEVSGRVWSTRRPNCERDSPGRILGWVGLMVVAVVVVVAGGAGAGLVEEFDGFLGVVARASACAEGLKFCFFVDLALVLDFVVPSSRPFGRLPVACHDIRRANALGVSSLDFFALLLDLRRFLSGSSWAVVKSEALVYAASGFARALGARSKLVLSACYNAEQTGEIGSL